MRKEYSDPIDNIFYNISDKVSNPLYNLGITPNMITIFSMITNFITCELLDNKQNKLGAVLILFTYFLDNLDGFMARKYKQVSKIGDYLDHGSDMIFGLTMMYQLYKQNKWDKFKIKLGIYLLFAFIMTIHLGCQENLNNSTSETLSYIRKLCKNPSKWIKYTRYFGPGTTILVICLLFLF